MKGKRAQLVLIMVLFALPLGAALLAGLTGWRPQGTRAHGTLVVPPVALAKANLIDASGAPIPWRNADSAWHVAIIAPPRCDSRCAAVADTLNRVWRGLNRHARRVEVHLLGEPDAATLAFLKTFPEMRVSRLEPNLLPEFSTDAVASVEDAVGLPVVLIDPNGFLALRYEPGFDPGGLRRDLLRLVR